MKTFTLTAVASAMVLCGAAALAGMSSADYRVATKNIEGDYESARAGCDALAANAKDICRADAKGKERVALADLGAAYKPTETSRYDARIARADADFALSKERCDDKAGNARDACMKEAHAAQSIARGEAKAQMDAADAGKAEGKAVAEARKAAAAGKRDAAFALDVEKCDAYVGSLKGACVSGAKSRYGKP